jgi:integrase
MGAGMRGLTDDIIKKATCAADGKRIELQDSDPSQLWLRVSPSGHKSFTVRYRIRGEEPARMTLGSYPDLRLPEARNLARKALSEVRLGNDPTALKAKPKGVLWRDYLNEYQHLCADDNVVMKVWSKGYAHNKMGTIRLHTQCWDHRHLESITQKDVSTLLEGIEDSPSVRRAVFNHLRPLFHWAVHRGDLVVSSIGVSFQTPTRTGARDRVLAPSELHSIWHHVTPRLGKISQYQRIIALLIITSQRRNEVAWSSWSEFDLQLREWTIPKGRSKNKKAHVVPLTDLAVWTLQEIAKDSGSRVGFLFPSDDSKRKPFSNFSRSKDKIDKELPHLRPWTPHDLRRTGATWLNDNGCMPHVVEALLNHSIKGIAQTYNRATYTDDIRVILDKWSNYLIELRKQKVAPLSAKTLEALDPQSKPLLVPVKNPFEDG